MRFIFSFLLLLSIILAGCVSAPPASPATSSFTPSYSPTTSVPTPADVIISFEPSINGKTLTISGKATVPDGALISYEVQSKDFSVPEAFVDGNAEVKDGKWTATIDLSKFPRGEIEIRVAFQTGVRNGTQPPEILRIYGEMGEKITGPQTQKSGDITRAEIVKTINY